MNTFVNGSIPLNVRLANWMYAGFYFACCFVMISYLGHALTSVNASIIGYSSVFSMDGMQTLRDTSGWSVSRIAFVYLTGPLTAFLMSVIVLFVFKHLDKRKIHVRTFLYWFSFNCFLYYLSSVVSGVVVGYNFKSQFFTGFVSFYAWLGWIENRTLVVLFLQSMVSLGYVFFLIRPVYELSFSNRLLVSRTTLNKFSSFALIPVLVGASLVLLSTFPMDMKHILLRLALSLVVLATMLLTFNVFNTGNLKVVKGGTHGNGWVTVFGLMLLLCLVARFLLSIPITLA